MAKLTEDMKELIKNQQAYVATATPDGLPNLGPKRSTRVLDDEHIIFTEMTGKHTYENLKRNPKVAIAVVDREQMKGFRFVGTAELLTEGTLYDRAKEQMEKAGRAAPRAVVKVHVEEIYDLGMPGSGDRIA